ncbi:MAG: FKBP-type peptidyl-prolyl cis-trans isomerase [bacterium]
MSLIRRIVSFHYTLRNPEGRILDTSRDAEPVVFLEGAGMIIDGLDEALQNAKPGEQLKVEVPPEKGYGHPDPSQVQAVPRDRIPVPGDIKIGDQYQTGPNPGDPVVTVVAVNGDQIMLDANHPMAGLQLTFEVEVMQARIARAEEINQGKPLPVED